MENFPSNITVRQQKKMDNFIIKLVSSNGESTELDRLLWEILWKPLNFPRIVRDSFKLDGQSIELVAKVDGRIVGGLVANWTTGSEVEIRHIALRPEFQNLGVGRHLVESLISTISKQGCSCIHSIARNTSVGFFRKLNFKTSPGTPPEHPEFKRHGITFNLMKMNVEQKNPADGKKRRR